MAARSQTPPSTPRLSDLARHLCIPTGITATGWPVVEEQAAEFGIRFDEWQAKIGSLALAKRSDGLYAAGEGNVVMSLPRQVGKTYLVGWMLFALAVIEPGMLVIWTAHHSRTSNETFSSMQSMARREAVRPFVERVRAANGQQEIVFHNGSRILFGARESGFGRGFAMVDVLVFDEAQILSESAMSDMVPATNAAPNGLVLMLGTPPRPKDPGEAFALRRAAAIEGDPSTLYVEFSADEDVDPSAWPQGEIDWEQVAKANPSFPARTSRAAVRRMFTSLVSPDAFRREALGVWDAASASRGLPHETWDRLVCGEDAEIDEVVCFGVKFALDGSHLGLSAAARTTDGRVLVDAVRQSSASEGIDWLVDFLTDAARLSRTAQIVVEGKAGTGYLIDRLRQAGVPKRVILTPTAEQAVTAHAGFLDAITSGRLTHYGEAELTRQVKAARVRKIGTQGGFGWEAPEGDTVALLDAATVAHWARCTTKRRPRTGGGVRIL